MIKNTKIVATIGPASNSLKILKQMITHGMNVARINASHGNHKQHKEIIENLRTAAKATKSNIGILYDLQGPKIRIGDLDKEGVTLKKGEKIILHDGQAYIEKHGQKYIPIQYKPLTHAVEVDEPILIKDGLVELKVLSHNLHKTQVECEVIAGGLITSKNGINAPKTALTSAALTTKDKADLEFASSADVDFIALSFVRTAADLELLRTECKKLKFTPSIIAKIERPEAMENLEEITKNADAIMIARGDLGIEIPAAKVPLAQRKIIMVANKFGKPVITATQVLNSMVNNPRPTRAEVSDAANAVFDQTDAIMLSNETAVGEYPVETIHILNEIIQSIETELRTNKELAHASHYQFKNLNPLKAITLNALELAMDLDAKVLVAVTKSGYTANQLAKYHSFLPIVVYTPNKQIKRQLSLTWGINEIHIKKEIDPTNPTPFLREDLIKQKLVKKGDEVVVCNAGKNSRERLIITFAV